MDDASFSKEVGIAWKNKLYVLIVEVLWFRLLAVGSVRFAGIAHVSKDKKDPPGGGSFLTKMPIDR